MSVFEWEISIYGNLMISLGQESREIKCGKSYFSGSILDHKRGWGTVCHFLFLSGGLEVPWLLMWLVSEYGSVILGQEVGFVEG